MITIFFAGALFQLMITRGSRKGFAYETIKTTAPAAASPPSLLLIIILSMTLTLWFIMIVLKKLREIQAELRT